jgi:hypothetical protein
MEFIPPSSKVYLTRNENRLVTIGAIFHVMCAVSRRHGQLGQRTRHGVRRAGCETAWHQRSRLNRGVPV